MQAVIIGILEKRAKLTIHPETTSYRYLTREGESVSPHSVKMEAGVALMRFDKHCRLKTVFRFDLEKKCHPVVRPGANEYCSYSIQSKREGSILGHPAGPSIHFFPSLCLSMYLSGSK